MNTCYKTRVITLLLIVSFVLPLYTYSGVDAQTPTFESVYINEDDEYILIGNSFIEVQFDKSTGGGISAIIDKETSIDLRPEKDALSSLYLFFFHNGSATEGALPWQAVETTYHSSVEGDQATLTIVNSNLKGYDLQAQTTITLTTLDSFVEMRLSIDNNEAFIIENILFPLIWGLGTIGTDTSDDCVFYPTGDGILLHDPLSELETLVLSGGFYPGTLSMQLLCHFDPDETGLYFAAYDTQGNPKKINYGAMEWGGVQYLASSFESFIPEVPGNDFEMNYDILIGSFHGDWYSAADQYKEWAMTTPFINGGKKTRGKNTPSWFFNTSIIQFVNRDNPAVEVFSLADIADMIHDYSAHSLIDTTALLIGWEQHGAWVGPYYYPPVEGESSFRAAMSELQGMGNHGFTYISGTVWRITRDDIGYADFELFNTSGLPWAALQKDQSPYMDPSYATIGWHSARMCPMTDFWHDMVVENALESLRLGCDVVQIDEFPIGSIFPCYNTSHNHPVGYTVEMVQAYASILEDIRAQGRSINPDFIMSTEEPCEFYLPYMDTYVSRDCAPEGLLYMAIVDTYGDKVEFIPFFSFVYHEYITCFGEGVGLDEGQALYFYPQMARAIGKMITTGEIIKTGGTPIQTADEDLLTLFTQAATATTTYLQPYILKGSPLPPPTIDVPLIKIEWYNAIQGTFGTPIYEPAVFTSAWRSDTNTKGYIFVNWHQEPISFTVELTDTLNPYSRYAISMNRNGEQSIIQANTSLPLTITLSLDSNDILLLELVASIDTQAPEQPTISGPVQGKINTPYTYTIRATDPDADMISYYVDWGDESDTGWIGPYTSDETISLDHTWEKDDTYSIQVKAKDIYGVESPWATLQVSMPKTRLFLKHNFSEFIHFFFPINIFNILEGIRNQ